MSEKCCTPPHAGCRPIEVEVRIYEVDAPGQRQPFVAAHQASDVFTGKPASERLLGGDKSVLLGGQSPDRVSEHPRRVLANCRPALGFPQSVETEPVIMANGADTPGVSANYAMITRG
jgi:hypothetical protein